MNEPDAGEIGYRPPEAEVDAIPPEQQVWGATVGDALSSSTHSVYGEPPEYPLETTALFFQQPPTEVVPEV